MKRSSKAAARVVVERSKVNAASRALWQGLLRFNREHAGRLDYTRSILSARDGRRRFLGGLILTPSASAS